MPDIMNAAAKPTPPTNATPLSTLIRAVASGALAAAEAQLADDVEWHQMPYDQKVKGKQNVMAWLRTGSADQKEPQIFNDVMASDWGVLEYWNIGTVSPELIEFGKARQWPFPKDPESLIGQRYRVAQCFVYHLNAARRIDVMRQYLDAGSVWAQFK